jgi:cytidylate kinase
MRIITISREFGSGGRELGKRLADMLEWDYYDREIITAIAAEKGMDEDYVEKALEQQSWQGMPLHFRGSFSLGQQSLQTGLLLEQKRVIEGVAKAGRDCVIVGRNADVLLRVYAPFNIFVCAEQESKIRRCLERSGEGEELSRREVERQMKRIDKGRAATREIITGSKWGAREGYHLTVNTTGWDIKELTPAVARFAENWFGRTQK